MTDKLTLGARLADEFASGTADLEREASLSAIPPPGLDPESMVRSIRAIKNAVDTLVGSRSVLDKALTARDLLLEGALVYRPSAGLLGVSGSAVVGGTGGYTDPRPILPTPPAPTNLVATAAIRTIILTWDLIPYRNHAFTEVWRNTVDNLGTAALLDTTEATVFTDATGTPGVTYFYWVRAVNLEGTPGPYNAASGVSASLGQDIAALLTLLSGQITESQLFATLGARIDLIDGSMAGSVNARLLAVAAAAAADLQAANAALSASIADTVNGLATLNAALAAQAASTLASVNALTATSSAFSQSLALEVNARAQADNILSAAAAAVGLTASGTSVALLQEANARTLADNVISGALSATGIAVGQTGAAIVVEQEARVTGDSATASQVTTLAAQVATGDSANAAAIVVERVVSANETSAVAAQTTSLAAVAGQNASAVIVEQQARVDADQASAVNTSTLTTAFGNNVSAIQVEQVARSTADIAQATQVTTLAAATGQALSAIVIEQDARATADLSLATQVTSLIATFSTGTGDPVNAAALFAEQQVRATADSAQASQIVGLTANVGQNVASILVEQVARATTDSALATQNLTLSTAFNANSSALVIEQQVRSDADSATSSQVTSLAATTGATTAALQFEQFARASGDAASAGTVSTLAVQVAAGDAINAAAIITTQTASATADSAQAQRIDALSSAVGANQSAVVVEQESRSTADNAVASQVVTVAAATGANIASVRTEEVARTDADSAFAAQSASLIASTGANSAAITFEQQARADADAATAARVSLVEALAGTSAALIQAEQLVRATADATLASQTERLTAIVGTSAAALVTEQQVRASADQVAATQTTTLLATTGATSAGLRTEQDVRASADSASAATITTLVAGVGNNQATIYGAQTASADADSAQAAVAAVLTATTGANTASVVTEAAVRAGADTSQASQISVLQATAGSLSAAIATEETARVNADNAIASQVTTVQSTLSNFGTNLLNNSSFEIYTGTNNIADGWSSYTAGTRTGSVWSLDSDRRAHGTRSQRAAFATSAGGSGDRIGVGQVVPIPQVAVGTRFTLSARMAGTAGARLVAYFEFRDSANLFIAGSSVTGTATALGVDTFQTVVATRLSVAGAAFLRILFWLDSVAGGGAGEVFIDAAQIQEGERTGYLSNDLTAAVQQEITTRASETGSLFAQWTVKLDVNGYVSGFGLASTAGNAAPTSSFIVRADNFAIASPSGPGITPVTPFIVQTTAGAWGPAGVYITNATIQDAAISTAKIANLAVDDAKISSLNATKINAGFLDAARVQTGSLDANRITAGTITADRFQVNLLQTDNVLTRGLTVRDGSGNVILSAGQPLQPANAANALRNDQITVNNGVLTGVGTSNIRVDNEYTSPDANVLSDPNFAKTAAGATGHFQSAVNWTISASAGENATAGASCTAGGTIRDLYSARYVQAEVGERWFITARIRVSSTFTNNGGLTLGVEANNAARTALSYWPTFSVNTATSGGVARDTWVTVSGEIVIASPAGNLTAFIRPFISVRETALAGTIDVSRWYVGKVAEAATVGAPAGTTVAGTDAATVVSNAANGNTAFTGTVLLRNNAAPTNNAAFGTITQTQTADGNVVVTVPYTYTQGAVPADELLVFFRQGGGTVVSSDPCFVTNAVSGSIRFTLPPSTAFTFGLQAIRKAEGGTYGTAILTSGSLTTSASNFTGNVNGVAASTVTTGAANGTAALTAVNDANTGLNTRLLKNAADTITAPITLQSAGAIQTAANNRSITVDSTGIVARDNNLAAADQIRLSFSTATGSLAVKGDISGSTGTFAGTVQVGSTPAISGSTMTGSGAVINSNGTCAFGNSTRNIVIGASGAATLNGDWVATGNLQLESVVKTWPASYTVATGTGAGSQTAVVIGTDANHRISIFCGGAVNGAASGDLGATVQLQRYSGSDPGNKVALTVLFGPIFVPRDGVFVFPPWTDTPGTGTWTYELWKTSGDGIGRRTMLLQEFKR